MASSLVCDPSGSNCAITDAVSASCGMALAETKLPKSIVSKPTLSNAFRYSIFFSVGINAAQPCIASRGHSTSETNDDGDEGCTCSIFDALANCYGTLFH